MGRRKVILETLGLLLVGRAQSAYAQLPFVHPGIYHNQAGLTLMQNMVASGTQPWLDGYNALAADSKSSPTYRIQGPCATTGRNPDVCKSQFENDANAAFQNAYMWAITGNVDNASEAIHILNAWSSTLTSIGGADARLAASLGGTKMIAAAEVLRYTNSGWTETGVASMMNLVRNVIHPVCTLGGVNNWGTGTIKCEMAAGIFLDDEGIFDKAVISFQNGWQFVCTGGLTYIQSQGWNGETDRDDQHSQLGNGHLAEAATIAWNQGIDLFSMSDNLILGGFEYLAEWIQSSAPFSPWIDCAQRTHNSQARSDGILRPIYEMVWNQYQNVMNIPAPQTYSAAQAIYPEGAPPYADHPGFGTILFSQPTLNSSSPMLPSGLTATPSDAQVALSWAASPGADSYNIKRSTGRSGPFTTLANVTSTSYTDSTAVSGCTYVYVVSGVNSAGETANSGLVISTPTNSAPATPNNVDAIQVSYDRISLSWTAPLTATGFNVKRATVSGGPYTTIATNIGTAWNYYLDTGLSPGTSYYYVVSASNAVGESSDSKEVSASTMAALPSGWTDITINQGLPGGASYSSGAFTVKGSGTDIGNSSDSFEYTYTTMTGDGSITARIGNLSTYSQLDKSGIVMRNSLDAADVEAETYFSPSGPGPSFFHRSSYNGGSSGTGVTLSHGLPIWVRLTRTGNTFTGYYSSDGTIWIQIASVTISMNSTIYVGLGVCSRNEGVLDTATFDNVMTP